MVDLRTPPGDEGKCCLDGYSDSASWINRLREDPFLLFSDNEGKYFSVTGKLCEEWQPLHCCDLDGLDLP